MIDFPANPTVGQQFTAAGVTWVWDGVKWAASGLSIAYVPLAGFVPAMNDNRIINSDMRVDQRNNGASGTANGYTVDRWQHVNTQSAKITWGRNLNAAAGPVRFPYYLGFQTSAAYTPIATDYFSIRQNIEADMICDFAWGTASAQTVTLSFWAYSSLTGTFSGCIANYAGTRSYPFTFSLPTANTWTNIAITIPGDTAGTWVMSGNGGSLCAYFDLGCGANNRGPANAWASANYQGATGSISLVTTLNATFYLTGVKFEIGSVATPFNRQSLAKSMADCQRYYQVISVSARATASAGGQTFSNSAAFQQMRAAPTATFLSSATSANVAATPLTIDSTNTGYFSVTSNAAGDCYAISTKWSLAAEL
jgi:hypothetical protein